MENRLENDSRAVQNAAQQSLRFRSHLSVPRKKHGTGGRGRGLFSCVICLSLIAGSFICAGINHMQQSAALARAGCSAVLAGIFLMVLFSRRGMLWEQISEKRGYLLAFAVSVCLTGISSRYDVGFFWMLLLVVAGCQKGLEIKIASYGMLMAVYLCNAVMVNAQFGRMEYYLVMGAAILLILSMVKKRDEIPHAGIILTALCLALLILGSGFDVQEMWGMRYTVCLELSSMVFLMLFFIMFRMVQGGLFWKPDSFVKVSVGELMRDDFVLMQQLKENQNLFRHSSKISRVSGLAAEALGCDSMLAMAGGMYHEMGRLLDQDDYLAANMELAREYRFPDSLQEVIRQHNAGSETPKSPEAAIVMLSDCIISTADYLERNGKRAALSNEKLVKNIFSNRMAKGSLDEAGLSVEDIKKLENFYIDNTFYEE